MHASTRKNYAAILTVGIHYKRVGSIKQSHYKQLGLLFNRTESSERPEVHFATMWNRFYRDIVKKKTTKKPAELDQAAWDKIVSALESIESVDAWADPVSLDSLLADAEKQAAALEGLK